MDELAKLKVFTGPKKQLAVYRCLSLCLSSLDHLYLHVSPLWRHVAVGVLLAASQDGHSLRQLAEDTASHCCRAFQRQLGRTDFAS